MKMSRFRHSPKGYQKKVYLNLNRETTDSGKFHLDHKAITCPVPKQSIMGHVFFSIAFIMESNMRRIKAIRIIFQKH